MKVLVTGATGYIGKRLVSHLLGRKGFEIKILAMNIKDVPEYIKSRCEIISGSTFDTDALNRALKGVHTAYYLIHSMGRKGDYEEMDRISALNFREACIKNRVKRVIYLGGLGKLEDASRHLRSRIETGEILSATPDKLQTLWFRAGVIIGAGGASFEMIKSLVCKLPVMITPKWIDTKTEAIGVDDVITSLADAALLRLKGDRIIDLGSGVTSFRRMMLEAAEVMNLKRVLLPVPFFSPKLSSYWLILFTPVNFGIAKALVMGLKSETVKLNNSAEELLPHIIPSDYKTAFKKAVEESDKQRLDSRWCDITDNSVCYDDTDLYMSSAAFKYVVQRKINPDDSGRIFSNIKSIGGDKGWFRYDFLWKIRGVIDKLSGGAGINRGRRDSNDLRTGDSLDFWKVVDLKENERLLLYAQMKLPGKAWLEFIVRNESYIQTAYFDPSGLPGKIYWNILLPVHFLIFNNIADSIIKKNSRK